MFCTQLFVDAVCVCVYVRKICNNICYDLKQGRRCFCAKTEGTKLPFLIIIILWYLIRWALLTVRSPVRVLLHGKKLRYVLKYQQIQHAWIQLRCLNRFSIYQCLHLLNIFIINVCIVWPKLHSTLIVIFNTL